jgi:hypothetical protein
MTLAFDPEQAREAPQAHMVTYGSVFLDRWIEAARGEGRTCRLWIRGLPVHPRSVPSSSSALSVSGAELHVGQGSPKRFETTVFSFRVSFRSDEREEERRVVTVDAVQGRIARTFLERLAHSNLSPDPGEGEVLEAAAPLEVARQYALACEELEKGLLATLQVRKQTMETRRSREAAKAAHYFDQMSVELSEEIGASREDLERAGRLLQKLAAVKAEKARQISQIEAKHMLSVHVGLSSVLVVAQPKVVFPCRISAPRLGDTELSLIWDPLLEAWMAPPCPTCAKPTKELLGSRHGVGCPLCQGSVLTRGR